MSAFSGNVALNIAQGKGFKNGGVVSVLSNTTLSVSACSAMSSDNNSLIKTELVTTVNAAVVGLNGIDTGTFAASKPYYVHMVGNSTNAKPTGFVLSLSPTAPNFGNLPGYDISRLISFAATDGSIHFLPLIQTGAGNDLTMTYDSLPQLLNDGTATSLTAITLTNYVPAIDNVLAKIYAEYTPATANDKASFASGTSVATVLQAVRGSVATKINSGVVEVLSKLVSSIPTIQYINSSSSGNTDVWLSSFKFSV